MLDKDIEEIRKQVFLKSRDSQFRAPDIDASLLYQNSQSLYLLKEQCCSPPTSHLADIRNKILAFLSVSVSGCRFTRLVRLLRAKAHLAAVFDSSPQSETILSQESKRQADSASLRRNITVLQDRALREVLLRKQEWVVQVRHVEWGNSYTITITEQGREPVSFELYSLAVQRYRNRSVMNLTDADSLLFDHTTLAYHLSRQHPHQQLLIDTLVLRPWIHYRLADCFSPSIFQKFIVMRTHFHALQFQALRPQYLRILLNSKMPLLQVLMFYSTRFQNHDLELLACSFPRLSELKLFNCRMRQQDVKFLGGASWELKILGIQLFTFADSKSFLLPVILNFTNLTQITLPEVHGEVFQAICKMSLNLTVLKIGINSRLDSCAHLFSLTTWTALTRFSLCISLISLPLHRRVNCLGYFKMFMAETVGACAMWIANKRQAASMMTTQLIFLEGTGLSFIFSDYTRIKQR